jgi:sec-independent protein translocase protein TatA
MPNWLGGWEILIILAVVLLIFGPTQLPKLAKMFGKAAKSLKDGIDGKLEDDDEKKAEVTSASAEKKDAPPASGDKPSGEKS